jgi:hypothetical protein
MNPHCPNESPQTARQVGKGKKLSVGKQSEVPCPISILPNSNKTFLKWISSLFMIFFRESWQRRGEEADELGGRRRSSGKETGAAADAFNDFTSTGMKSSSDCVSLRGARSKGR